MLLLISLVNYPLLAWSRRRVRLQDLDAQDFVIFLGQGLAIALLSLLEFGLMKNKYDYWNYVLPANIVLFLGMVVQMFVQVYLQKIKVRGEN